jgi:hypothetical protein
MLLRRIRTRKERENKEQIQKCHVSQQCSYQVLNLDYTCRLFQVSAYLPSMYTELQTFAVAMEALIENDPKSVSLNETNDYLIQVLAKSKLYSLNIYIWSPVQDTSFRLTMRCVQSACNSVHRSPYWHANSCSVNSGILPIIRNAKPHYRVHKKPPLAPIQGKFSTVHNKPYPPRPVLTF